MNGLLERFLRYVAVGTQADPARGVVPSTPGQMTLAKMLEKELAALGLEDVRCDEHAYVTGTLPASSSAGKDAPCIGLLAHLDTALDASGENVKARVIENYDGGDIPLAPGMTLSPAVFPVLERQKGNTLIVTDGSTLLGGDDKSGIAIIMTVLEHLTKHPELPHGPVKVAFAPDEEIAHGCALLDLDAFGADFAYTIDSMGMGSLEYETFNAAKAEVVVRGVSVHPGSSKDRMINAILLGMEFVDALPHSERPDRTEGYEGFFHVNNFKGAVGETTITMIIRDHDAEKFEARKALVRDLVDRLNAAHPSTDGPHFTLKITEQYRNMADKLKDHMHIVETAKQAISEAGITPVIEPVRGGTDGAQLSWRGLPTPNLFGGFYNAHGEYEFASLQDMEASVDVVLRILQAYGKP
ncbi:peptidase T [Desulfovibrio sp. OttesenSCG-928-I05]|nr:peptidase T [Desulfovibrio sp. OttesenSCG-928-I05]